MVDAVAVAEVREKAKPVTDLLAVEFPGAFGEGARNAVTTCLKIQADEKVTLITDRSCIQIAASIATELEKLGCAWNGFVLEEIATRPLNGMPEEVLDDMESSQVSIFAVEVQPNELKSRMQMTDVVNRRRMRHAHMVNITPEIMTQGMRADFNEVDKLSQAVLDRVRKATYVRATTAAGTDLHAQMEPGVPVVQDERYHQPGEVGEPAGRGVLYGSGRGERRIRGGWRRRGLPVQGVRVDHGDSADDPH